MSRYRTVDVRLWSDRRFLSLSDDGKLLWMFYLTCPQRLAIPGVIIGGEASLAEQLGWTVEQYRKGYQELLAKGMRVRSEGRVVWLTNALKYQAIAGPKAMTGMAKAWDDVPEGELKTKIWEELKIACKRWASLFTKLFPKHHGEGYAQLVLDGVSDGASLSGPRPGPRPRPGSGKGGGADAPAAPEVPEPEETASHQEAVDTFHQAYLGAYSSKPRWTDKQIGMMVQLVKSHGSAEVVRRIGILFTSPPSFLKGPHDVATLVQHFDKLVRPAAATPAVPARQTRESGLDVALRIAEGG